MIKPLSFRKTEDRTFFAHHMLLHAAERQIAEAEDSEIGRFNKCLAAMVMSALAIEALVNAVGASVAEDWKTFERLRPHKKIDLLIAQLGIKREGVKEPWETLRGLARFRNDIAHPKPEKIAKECVLSAIALDKTDFKMPLSTLERKITLRKAKQVLQAVQELKRLFTDALPPEARFGIYADMWHVRTKLQ